MNPNPADVLAQLNLALPPAPKPVAAYVPVRRAGDLLFVAGQIPMLAGKPIALGLVPTAVSVEAARRCAVQCTLNALAAVAAFLSDEADALANRPLSRDTSLPPPASLLSHITQVIRLGCFVASPPDFSDHPQVANAASELLIQLFQSAGVHARAAVGSSSLPLGVPVEIDFMFQAPPIAHGGSARALH